MKLLKGTLFIARTRHINHYGLEAPRLDRLQGLYEYTKSQTNTSLKYTLFEVLSFYLSVQIFVRITALWNGRVVYHRHWRLFFADMRAEWGRMGGLVCGLVSLVQGY